MRLTILCLLLIGFAACTKDANRDIENPGIGFLYGANAKNDLVVRPSATPQKISNFLVVNLLSAELAVADMHVSIADKTTDLVNAYNTAHGTTIEALPAANWSMPAELVIKKGERNVAAEITVNSTLTLNYSKQYAIGVAITGVSDGRTIASNQGDVLMVFRVQNELDGRYFLKGDQYKPIFGNTPQHHRLIVELHTVSPNVAKIFWHTRSYGFPEPLLNPNCCFASQEVSFYYDPSNHDIFVYNSEPSSSIFYTQVTGLNGNTYHNRYDNATGTVYAAWGYVLGAGGVVIPGTSRAMIDTLTYLGPQ